MIVKNFINGQITTGTEPIDPISGVSRGLYINSVLSGNSSSDTLVGLDINPSYSGTAGNYFGLRVSGDTIFATSGGTLVMRTFNTGNVVVGSSTDNGYKLDVSGTTNTARLRVSSSGAPSIQTTGNRLTINEPSNGPQNETGFVTQFSSGVYGRSIFAITHTDVNTAFFGLNGTTNFTIGAEQTTPITFRQGMIYTSSDILSSGTERMRISSSGNLLIGTTTDAGHKLYVNGTSRFLGSLTGTSSTFTGTIIAGQNDGTSYNHTFYGGLGTITFQRFDSYANPNFIVITQPNYGMTTNGSNLLVTFAGTSKPTGSAITKILSTVQGGGSSILEVGSGTNSINTSHASVLKVYSNSMDYFGPTYTGLKYIGVDVRYQGRTADYGTTSGTSVVSLYLQSNFYNRFSSTFLPLDSWKGLHEDSVFDYMITPYIAVDITPTFTNTIGGTPLIGLNINPSLSNYTGFTAIQSVVGNVNLNIISGTTNIGTSGSTGFKLYVSGSTLLRGSGTTSASYALATQNSSGGTTMVVNNAGSVLVGTTTDAGHKLDVNGTIRGQSGLWGGDVFLGNISGTRFIYLPSGYGLYIGSVGNTPTVLGDGIFSTTLNATINRFTLTHSQPGSEQVTKLVGNTSVNHLNPFFDIVAGITSSPPKEIDMRIYTDYYSGTQRWGNIILGHNGNNTAGNILMGTNVGNGSRLLVGGTVSGATLNTTRAVHIAPTLLATGNTTTLIGLDIQPTYSIGSYTGLTQIALRVSGGTQIIGSGSTGTTLSLFSVDGASGRLFDVTDDFTNSLFSVNTSSGVPVIEAFANNSVVMGTYGSNTLVVSGTSVGIGKTSPSYKLDVNGDINVSERLLIESYSSATTQTTSVISASTTNSNLALVPNGTGAIVVSVPDATSIGGNSRGNYAVDLQKNRLLSTNVASGNYSSIVGGYNNAAIGEYSLSVGKDSNSYLYGQQSFSSGYFASVGDTQHSTVFLRGVGTGGTAFSFYLTLDGTSSGNYLTPSGDNRTWGVKVLYTATCIQPGVGNNYVKGDSSMGEYLVLLRKSGGTTSIIDTSSSVKVSSSLFINDRLTFDIGSNQDLRLLYTAPSASVNGNVIRAVAKLTLIEIGY